MSAVTPGEARALARDLDDVHKSHIQEGPTVFSEGASALRSLSDLIVDLTSDLTAEKLFSKQAMESVTEIAAQRDALTTDALRYRFMRDVFAKESSDAAGAFAALEPMTGVDFDAAIDAAMEEAK